MVWLIGGIIVIAAVFALLWRTSTPPTAVIAPDREPAEHDD